VIGTEIPATSLEIARENNKDKNTVIIVTPPIRGIGLECTFRTSGLSQKYLIKGDLIRNRNIRFEKMSAIIKKETEGSRTVQEFMVIRLSFRKAIIFQNTASGNFLSVFRINTVKTTGSRKNSNNNWYSIKYIIKTKLYQHGRGLSTIKNKS
jgi:hypothetical protein